MSVQSEIERLNTAKADIRTAIIDKGVDVADDLSISNYAAKINEISSLGTEEYIDVNLDCFNVDLEFYNGSQWESISSASSFVSKTIRVKKGCIIAAYLGIDVDKINYHEEIYVGKVMGIYISTNGVDNNTIKQPKLWYCFGDCSITYKIYVDGGSMGGGSN